MGVATSSRSARRVVAATSNPWSESSQRSQRCTKAATPTLVPGWLLNDVAAEQDQLLNAVAVTWKRSVYRKEKPPFRP